MFAGNFPPRSWALCHGQLLPISQNDALFSLLGTTFGGDGETTYGLPDFQGRAPVHVGQGPGFNHVDWGEKGGAETVTLTTGELPSHNHLSPASSEQATETDPAGRVPGVTSRPGYAAIGGGRGGGMTGSSGGGESHYNMQPYLGIYFIIALYGIYPSPS